MPLFFLFSCCLFVCFVMHMIYSPLQVSTTFSRELPCQGYITLGIRKNATLYNITLRLAYLVLTLSCKAHWPVNWQMYKSVRLNSEIWPISHGDLTQFIMICPNLSRD